MYSFNFTPRKFVEKLYYRLRRELQTLGDEKRDLKHARDFSLHALGDGLTAGITQENLAENFRISLRKSFFITVDQREQIVSWLKSYSPRIEALTISEAERICCHEFDLLGSGIVPLGDQIDWHKDFKSGYSFKPDLYFKRIRPASYPGGYDIKVPWELSRCQHFARLGQAYWFSGDERYGEEFIAQILDWINANPWPFGVNWSCTMDVAIRAVNWLWGLAFFIDYQGLTDEILVKIYSALWLHGQHIINNLEITRDLTTNHYLADLLGLVYLGILLPELKESIRWREFGLVQLELEIQKQVYNDGVSFEASTSYHRLAAELFLSAMTLAQKNGSDFSPAYKNRLEKMVEFLMYVTRSDGSVPLIGDHDNGRIHRLSVWQEPGLEWVNFQYLFAIGGFLFDRQDFASAAGRFWQDAVWLLGSQMIEYHDKYAFQNSSAKTDEPASKAFPAGGIYIMRSGGWHLVIDCGSVGLNGVGGHAHNDALSIDFFADGINWLIDPGTYLYTGDYIARNKFRSTPFHNTVSIDNEEQNQFARREIFRLTEFYPPIVNTWTTNKEFDLLSATQKSYLRLKNPVLHERRVYFKKNPPGFLFVRDVFTGVGDYTFSWYYQTGSDHINVEGNSLLFTKQDRAMVILFDKINPLVQILPGWQSTCFGSRVPVQRVRFDVAHTTPFEVRYIICLVNPESNWRHAVDELAMDIFKINPDKLGEIDNAVLAKSS